MMKISVIEILHILSKSDHNGENPPTKYDCFISASTCLSLSRVFSPEPDCSFNSSSCGLTLQLRSRHISVWSTGKFL